MREHHSIFVGVGALIFSSYGIEIYVRNKRFFVRYDGGDIAVKMVEHEITEDEAAKVQLGEKEAYEVILKAQSRSKIN